MIDSTIEECSQERDPDEPPASLIQTKRVAVDTAFSHNKVEDIISSLKGIEQEHEAKDIRDWASATLAALELRSPTSLKVALMAIRKGKTLPLLEALQMELNIATAFCVMIFFVLAPHRYLRPHFRAELVLTSVPVLPLFWWKRRVAGLRGCRRLSKM